jgi:orotate phosphoribosyltransferase
LLSSPVDFCCVVDTVADEIERVMVIDRVDKSASIELKGVLLLPSIAFRLKLPCVVVRKAEKKYGVTGRIVGGKVVNGECILFLDDVVTDGMSKVEGVKPLEKFGAHVETVMVVVDRKQGGRENVEKFGYEFRALTTISELVRCLLQLSCISEERVDAVLSPVKKVRD